MVQKKDSPAAIAEKPKEKAPKASETRKGLDSLKKKVNEKAGLTEMVQDLLKDFGKLDSKERVKRIGAIISAAAFGYIFGKDKVEAMKKTAAASKGQESAEAEKGNQSEESEEAQKEEEKIEDPREQRRKVVCNNARLVLINTDPAGNLRPSHMKGKSSYLLEYGLPELGVFKEEMISMLAPDASGEKEGLSKVINILKRCPMGMYQCMPMYLFGFIPEFKKLKWKEEGQNEEKIEAMWKFLQNEEMQREATRGYLLRSANSYGGDSQLVAASFYGGPRAANALKAYRAEMARRKRIEDGTATEKDKEGPVATPDQIQYIEKKQGAYSSIKKYAGYDPSKGSQKGSFDIDKELAKTASRESGAWRNKKSKERDEKWESDQRYAYNRPGNKEIAIA